MRAAAGSTAPSGSAERVTGIEPAPSAWKAEALPLSYTRWWPAAAGRAQGNACRRRAHLRFGGSAARTLDSRSHGVWRSLVAHSLWERGAVGSNPATPTVIPLADRERTPDRPAGVRGGPGFHSRGGGPRPAPGRPPGRGLGPPPAAPGT